ncbi:spore germination protein [Bacillus sp. Bos-x628]|uniref:spore germination protein n=1 Tax=Bacillus maqinnsis TaxID=3229854 RepID=UPI00338EFCF4
MTTNHIYIQEISGQAIVNFGNVGRICPKSVVKDTAGADSAYEFSQLSGQSLIDAAFRNNVQIKRGRCMKSLV